MISPTLFGNESTRKPRVIHTVTQERGFRSASRCRLNGSGGMNRRLGALNNKAVARPTGHRTLQTLREKKGRRMISPGSCPVRRSSARGGTKASIPAVPRRAIVGWLRMRRRLKRSWRATEVSRLVALWPPSRYRARSGEGDCSLAQRSHDVGHDLVNQRVMGRGRLGRATFGGWAHQAKV